MESLHSYQQRMADRILQAKPEELMVMLYEGMATKIKQGRERFEAGKLIQAKESFIRAMRIADALSENLNFRDGGEVVENLASLYLFIINQLSQAVRSENPTPHIENSLKVIEILHEGWKKLLEKAA